MAVLFASSVWAGDIQSRMKARLPIITKLKAQGLVGENNRGLLEYRTGKKLHQKVINQENADRKRVYQSIAKKQGAKIGVVGQHRAAQIAKKAPKKTWLQDAKGRWYRK
jgi:uncharacterized protein YdbL (DUF1318 family)